jgi:hypothetical protein
MRNIFGPPRHPSQQSSSEPTKGQREAARRPLFVPLPFTIEEVPAQPFKPTDPEFQEYIRISKDSELQSKLKEQICEIVRATVDVHRSLNRDIGKGVVVRKTWLDVGCPDRPFPTFEWKG